MSGLALAALVLVPGLGIAAVSDAWEALVGEGRGLWTQAPPGASGVACQTCHHDPAEPRGWAPAFPRFRPEPPPQAGVRTLLQATAEAVRRHYPRTDRLEAATAITAYLTTLGAGRPLVPGVTPGEPVFPARAEALAASVARGRARYARSCAACHDAEGVAAVLVEWWRLVRDGAGPAETFLERHRDDRGLAWDGPDTADLLAYLTSLRAGRRLGPAECEGHPCGNRSGQAATSPSRYLEREGGR